MREPNLTVPLTESKMTSFMRHQPEVYNDKPLTPTFYRYFEVNTPLSEHTFIYMYVLLTMFMFIAI